MHGVCSNLTHTFGFYLMTKKIILAVAAVVTASFTGLQARILTPQEAIQRAQSSAPRSAHGIVARASMRHVRTVDAPDSNPAVYIVTAGDSAFAVLSADDCAPAVLGYGATSDAAAQSVPEMEWWLHQYASQIQYARQQPAAPAQDNSEADTLKAIEPLAATRWGQGAPYNDMCPVARGRRCVTGCVATAMAQVMRHHQWPESGTGLGKYRWRDTTLSVDYTAQNYDWAEMTDTYNQRSTPAERRAVAQLMYDCGVAVRMVYGEQMSSSSSIMVPQALITNFGYAETARYEPRDFYTAAEWTRLVYRNLQQCGPVQYSGFSNNGGHSFVCDGYRPGGYFHINWGWGGACDGYFLLSALNPDGSGAYSYGQDIIAGVQRPGGAYRNHDTMYMSADFTPLSQQVKVGDGVYFAGNFYNYASRSVSGNFGIRLVSHADSTVTILPGTALNNVASMRSVYSFNVAIPRRMADGVYTVTPVYRPAWGEWTNVQVRVSCMDYAVMTVKDGTVSFGTATRPHLTIRDIVPMAPITANTPVEIEATVLNPYEAKSFKGNISLVLTRAEDGTVVAETQPQLLDIKPDQWLPLEFKAAWPDGTPNFAPGQYTIHFVSTTGRIVLSEPEAVTVSDSPSGVESPIDTAITDTRYVDLMGRPLETPHGLCIRIQRNADGTMTRSKCFVQ